MPLKLFFVTGGGATGRLQFAVIPTIAIIMFISNVNKAQLSGPYIYYEIV